MIVDYISDIESGRLLIFIGFGISLLIFSINSKFVIANSTDDNGNNRIKRYVNAYRFIKIIFNYMC